MKNDFDILVIGGGMVGVCTAALMAADKTLGHLRIGLMDAQPPTTPPDDHDIELRVSALSRATERILNACGAWEKLPPSARSAYVDMLVWESAGQPHGPGSVHFTASATGEPNLGYIVENRRVQWALYEAAPLRQKVEVLRARLTQLELDPEAARVHLADGRRLTAGLLIGADGAESSSRKLAGITTGGWDYGQSAVVAHVRTERPHRSTAWQRFLSTGPVAFLPLTDGRSSIVWSTTPEEASALVSAPAEEFSARLTAASDNALGAVELASARAQFPLKLSYANAYCATRFALVGDAAHTVHPLAGQGVNLGFLDAAALVQTLAEAVSREGSAALGDRQALRRYERWRKSEITVAMGMLDGLNRLFSNSSPLLGRWRRAGLSIVDRNAWAKRFFVEHALGLAGEVPRIAATAA
jgi:2-octaprenylphenol hydroxylase